MHQDWIIVFLKPSYRDMHNMHMPNIVYQRSTGNKYTTYAPEDSLRWLSLNSQNPNIYVYVSVFIKPTRNNELTHGLCTGSNWGVIISTDEPRTSGMSYDHHVQCMQHTSSQGSHRLCNSQVRRIWVQNSIRSTMTILYTLEFSRDKYKE